MWKKLKRYAKRALRFLKDNVQVTVGDSGDLFNKNDLPH